MNKSLMPFDELDVLEAGLGDSADSTGRTKTKQQVDDELLDLFLLAYMNGYAAVNEMFGTDFKPDLDDVNTAIYEKIGDEDWPERVAKAYIDGDPINPVKRIAETEMHRIYNRAVLDAGKKAGAKTKTWETMLDDKVRDSHDYLQSMTVPFDQDFYTYNNDHAPGPGLFGIPEEDINCRCFLTLA